MSKARANADATSQAYIENATTAQELSGTYTGGTERLYFNDLYTLTGNVTIQENAHLALGTIADKDVTIEANTGSTERTITGEGTLESGRLMNDLPSLTGMTGELGNAVSGSPALVLTNTTTFPTSVAQSYEEGTWTPEIADATSGGNRATPGSAVGNYTRIGNLVTVNAFYNMASESLTDGNILYIRGFPFSTSSLANCSYVGTVHFYRIDTLVNTTLIMDPSASVAYAQEKLTASAAWNVDNITCGDIRYASTCNIRLNITYQTDS